MALPYATSGYLAKASGPYPSCDVDYPREQSPNRAQTACGIAAVPSRETLASSIEELVQLSGRARDLADRSRQLVDHEFFYQSSAVCEAGQAPPLQNSAPHLGENLSVINGRLYSIISNLESLVEFVGR